ncbi:VOC family protein [Alteribacter keqinensis]|uniref:VOC family protein n=1 Tax=Alteribacter keqinensis TaxID=2483800 RepID=UPI00115D8EB9|nr:VOC family protein [Alteribacter keqinensis]
MGTIKYEPKLKDRLGSVDLNVKDLDRAREFYERVIGLKVLDIKEDSLTFGADGGTPLVTVHTNENVANRPARTTGLFHLAVLLPDRKKLAHTLKHLLASGYPLHGASDHQFSEAIYLADPDGNGIEIYADTDPKTWKQEENGWYVGGTHPLDVEGLLKEAPADGWTGMSAEVKIGHLHLQVADIQEVEAFYVDILGFDIVTKDPRMLFVSKDGYHHHIGLNTWTGTNLPKPPKEAVGMKQFTVFFTEDEYHAAKEALNVSGAENKLQVEDPSGNAIVIVKKQ